jgi:hypothetical protein
MAAEFEPSEALADAYDSTGRRLTSVDELIHETVLGDVTLSSLEGAALDATAAAWEAVARDLARQVINCETEIAELDEVIEDKEDAVSDPVEDATDLDVTAGSRDYWHDKWYAVTEEFDVLYVRCREEEQAHCDTYVEAVRLAAELAGWQNSNHAEYRRSTAARRLEQYRKAPVAYDVGAGF